MSTTSDKMFFLRSSRDLHRVDVCVADTTTGAGAANAASGHPASSTTRQRRMSHIHRLAEPAPQFATRGRAGAMPHGVATT